MATITRIDRVQRFIVDGDPTSGIPAVCNPGDRIYRQDTATEYVMTQAGVVAEASLDDSPVFSGHITISGSTAAPAGTVRYIGSPNSGSTSLRYNVLTGGVHRFCVADAVHLGISSQALTVAPTGLAFSLSGGTVSGTNTASGAFTLNANIGTGTGAVGGFVLKVPVTTGSGTTAQTLTTALTIDATTFPLLTCGGKLQAAVSTTARAGFNLGNAGTAPTSPVDGDMWIESNTIKARLNGATVTVTTS